MSFAFFAVILTSTETGQLIAGTVLCTSSRHWWYIDGSIDLVGTWAVYKQQMLTSMENDSAEYWCEFNGHCLQLMVYIVFVFLIYQ